MNYIKEINAFRNYLKTNPLEAITQALWYTIADYHNSCNWERWITIDNTRLMAELQVSEKTLIRHRNKLIQGGLIEYKSQQRKKKSGRYRLLSFELREVRPQKTTDANIDEEKMSGKSAVKFTADQGADVGADQGADVGADQGADGSDLIKLNKTKLNKEEDKDAREFAKVISVFQNNIHPPTPIEAEKISHWLEEVDADVVIHAITEAVNYNARSMSYINSILNDYTRKSIKTKADLDAYLRDKQDQKCVVDFKKYKRGEADAQARSGGFRPIPREWLE